MLRLGGLRQVRAGEAARYQLIAKPVSICPIGFSEAVAGARRPTLSRVGNLPVLEPHHRFCPRSVARSRLMNR